jgi:fermentation-respiration switch protein FrsA (DUF1100 family)
VRRIMIWLAILLAAYAGLALAAHVLASRMLSPASLRYYADGPKITKLRTPDGVILAARYLPAPGARFTVVYFHGTGEDLGWIEPVLEEIRLRLGVAVLAFDYRGYGLSGGRSSEAAIYADTKVALAWLRESAGVTPGQIIVWGRSLGGGPATELASRVPVAGLVLESTFTSVFRLMTRVPLLPLDPFDNLVKLPRVHCPVLVMHGKADEVVPFANGVKLLAAAPDPKRHLWVDGAGHNDLAVVAGERYWQAARELIALAAAMPNGRSWTTPLTSSWPRSAGKPAGKSLFGTPLSSPPPGFPALGNLSPGTSTTIRTAAASGASIPLMTKPEKLGANESRFAGQAECARWERRQSARPSVRTPARAA